MIQKNAWNLDNDDDDDDDVEGDEDTSINTCNSMPQEDEESDNSVHHEDDDGSQMESMDDEAVFAMDEGQSRQLKRKQKPIKQGVFSNYTMYVCVYS